MKTRRDIPKKVLSLMLSLLLVAGTFCFFNPFKTTEAEAATAGSYKWQVQLKVRDDYDWKHDAMNVYVDYYTNNGYGSDMQNNGNSYFHVNKNQFENDNADYTFEGWSAGFPVRVRLSAMKNKNSMWNANYQCILRVYNNNTGSWVQLADSGKVTGIRKGKYLKNLDVGTRNSDNGNWPKVNKVVIGGSDMTMTVPSGSTAATAKTASATVYDQFGVEWYQEPDSYVLVTSAGATTNASITGISCTTAGGDTSTVTVQNSAKDWVSNNGESSRRVVYIRAKKGDKISTARKITITNCKLTSTFYNYDESAKNWKSLGSTYPYYNNTVVTSPTVTRAGWAFNGWTTSKEQTAGSPNMTISTRIKNNSSWYAQWTKTVTGRFHYLTANGEATYTDSSKVLTTRETSFVATAPTEASAPVTYDGRTFKFLGWRADTTAAGANTTDFTVTSNYNNETNSIKNFYAVYSSDINFRFDGNGGTVSGANKKQTQYLSASGNKTSHTFDLTGVTASLANTNYAGWAESADANDAVAANKTFTITSDKTVYAVYKCNVRFFNEGKLIKTVVVTRNHNAADPSPLPDTAPAARPQKAFDDEYEYYFTGWDKSLTITGHTDINAVFETVAHEPEDIDEPGFPAVKPTCTSDGQQTWRCKHRRNDDGEVCGYEKTIVLPSPGHKWVTKEGKDATCTEKGYTVDIRCGICGFVDKESVEIPAKGHDFVFVKTVENTCVNEGYDLYECSREGCTATEKRNIVAPDSSKHEPVVVAEVPATCVANGTTEYTICSLCKAIIDPPKTITTQGHDWDITPAVEPTCTKAGSTEGKVCKICGTVGAEVKTVPALGHNYVTVSAKEPTCTEKGNTPGSYCTRCGDGNVKFVDALGHDFKDLTVTKEATCSEEGLKVGGCARCGEGHVEEVIPKLPHTPVTIPAVEATCSKAGHTEGTKCDVCGEIIKAPEKVRMLDHTWEVETEYVAPTCTTEGKTVSYKCAVCGETKGGNTINKLNHSYSEWVTTKPASCGVTGEKVRRCVNCNKIETGIIKALNHEFVVVDGVEATCTKDGTTVGSKCKNCGMWEVEPVVIPAPGHSFGDEITVEATCMAEGKIYKVCAVCGEEEIVKVLEKTAHNEVVIPAVEPTCTRVGKTEGKKCSVCGEITVAPENIEPAEHTPVVDVEAKAATCMSVGNTEGTKCAVCGKIITKARKIAAEEHTLTPWEYTLKSTCDSNGIRERHCTQPGCTYTETEITLPFGHSYGDWAVTVEPTCVDEGTKQCVCARCGDVIDQTIPANGHSKVTVPEVPAKCEENGVSAGVKCSVCGEEFEGFDVIPAIGHDYVMTHVEGDCDHDSYDLYVCKHDSSHTYTYNTVAAPGHTGGTATCTQKAVCDVCGKEYGELAPHSYSAVVTKPTCTKGGYTTYTCTECGDSYVGDYTAATGEHDFTDGIVVKEPTCTEAGSKTITCKSCGISVSVEVPAKGHTVNEWTVNGSEASGTCTECGETVTRPATNDDIKACERCGYHHTRSTGLFKYKGVFCSIIYFFRQIAKFFKGGK